MIKINTVTSGETGENCYILDCGDEVALIDPGCDYRVIDGSVNDKPCTHVLLTHAHYDHIGAVAHYAALGAKVYLHEGDVKLLNGLGNLAALFGEKLDSFVPDILLRGGEELDICGNTVKVISTPGHTDGSVCYVYGDVIFSGDTLFYLSVGRTDFPSGNREKLNKSIKEVLFALDGDYNVLPGHGERTTLSFEKKNNPYV